MKTILFPTDFSDNSTHASRYVGMLAKRLNAKVVLLHIYSIPMVSPYELSYESQDYMLKSSEEAARNLQVFTTQFIENTKLLPDQVTQMVEYGLVADIIVETAQFITADLIVMGTQGATNALDRWLGTIAQSVMESAECPVWIVPENAPINYPEKIMYAADLKEDEIVATHTVVDMAKLLGATCNVVHINDYFESNEGQDIQEMKHSLQNEFEHEDTSFQELNRVDIIKGLETYIKTRQPDVLAFAVHDKSFLSKIFLVSIAKHFVQEANLPMLTFRK